MAMAMALGALILGVPHFQESASPSLAPKTSETPAQQQQHAGDADAGNHPLKRMQKLPRMLQVRPRKRLAEAPRLLKPWPILGWALKALKALKAAEAPEEVEVPEGLGGAEVVRAAPTPRMVR